MFKKKKYTGLSVRGPGLQADLCHALFEPQPLWAPEPQSEQEGSGQGEPKALASQT